MEFGSTAVLRLALVGDVLFKGSIGRTDFPRGDYSQLINSIRGRLWPLGDDVVFIGQQGSDEISAREMAASIGAIPWEVICRLGSRIERQYEAT